MAYIDLNTQEHDQFQKDKLEKFSDEQKEKFRVLLGNAIRSKDKDK